MDSGLTDMLSGNWSFDLTFLRTVFAMSAALAAALLIIRIANRFLPKLAEQITDQAAIRGQGDKLLAVKRTETILNVIASVGRGLLIFISLYIGWRLVNPGSAPLAVIGASTLFVLIGAATVSPILRDITSGIMMISERWYEVGDYVVVMPFADTSGVVEQVNLRSTRLRSLTGEVIWLHNQNIQGVRVTPRGLRTISIDIFVRDKKHGRALFERIIPILPTGPSTIVTPLTISGEERLGDVWRMTATGQTTPGREWLIEDFAIKALFKADAEHKKPVMAYDPISRYTDEIAERRFQSSIKGRRGREDRQEYVTKVEEL